MRTIVFNGIAALALIAAPAFAQDAGGGAPQTKSADQANAETPPAPPTTTVVTDAATGAGAVVTTIPGNDAGPPPAALNKSYPKCSRTVQDECQNPGEGGAPGRSRALKYRPGHPASERK
jgi:hypothetical protein